MTRDFTQPAHRTGRIEPPAFAIGRQPSAPTDLEISKAILATKDFLRPNEAHIFCLSVAGEPLMAVIDQ